MNGFLQIFTRMEDSGVDRFLTLVVTVGDFEFDLVAAAHTTWVTVKLSPIHVALF